MTSFEAIEADTDAKSTAIYDTSGDDAPREQKSKEKAAVGALCCCIVTVVLIVVIAVAAACSGDVIRSTYNM